MTENLENFEIEDEVIEEALGEDDQMFSNKPYREKIVGVVLPERGLNIRAEANKNSEIVGVISKDDTVSILDEVDDDVLGDSCKWFKIVYDLGLVGYCMKEYIEEK